MGSTAFRAFRDTEDIRYLLDGHPSTNWPKYTWLNHEDFCGCFYLPTSPWLVLLPKNIYLFIMLFIPYCTKNYIIRVGTDFSTSIKLFLALSLLKYSDKINLYWLTRTAISVSKDQKVFMNNIFSRNGAYLLQKHYYKTFFS